MTTLRDESVHPQVTTGPISGSRKVYANGVPARRIELTNGEHLNVYDTSGPYTDPDADIDLTTGLPPLRTGLDRRPGRGHPTRLGQGRCGDRGDAVRGRTGES